MNNEENTPKTTLEEGVSKTVENGSETSENNTQKPDNQQLMGIMDVLKVPVREPSQTSGSAPNNPFEETITDKVSSASEDAGDVLESMIEDEGDGSPMDIEDADLVAETLIEGMDTLLSFGGQLAVMEFNDDKDARYSLPEKRKERLKKPLGKLMMKRGKMISPETAFALLSFIYILPVLVKVIGDVVEKRKKKKKEDAKREALAEGNNKKAGDNKGGRPRKCKICDLPETNKKDPKKICTCDVPEFPAKA